MHRFLVSGFLLAVLASGIAPVAVAERLVRSMTPENIEDALRLAADEKAARRFLDLYVLQTRAGWGNGPRIGIFSTPFSRVVHAAVAARKQGKSLAAVDVSPNLMLPEFHVIATSQKAASDDTDVNVYSVAIAPRGSKEATEGLQPLKTMELTTEYQDLHGTAFVGAGVVTVFLLSSLPADCEIRVMFDHTARGSSAVTRCRDCVVPLNLDRVR